MRAGAAPDLEGEHFCAARSDLEAATRTRGRIGAALIRVTGAGPDTLTIHAAFAATQP